MFSLNSPVYFIIFHGFLVVFFNPLISAKQIFHFYAIFALFLHKNQEIVQNADENFTLNYPGSSGMMDDSTMFALSHQNKGGENMSIDAIKQVTDTEEQAKVLVAQAQAQAKALVDQARKAGEVQLAEARKAAQAQARERLAQAEAAGAQRTQAALAEYETDCQALKERAQARLPQAAQLIVGKVVRS